MAEKTDFERTRQAGIAACAIIREAVEDNKLSLPDREINYLNRLEDEFDRCSDEDAVLKEVYPQYQDLVLLQEYGLD